MHHVSVGRVTVLLYDDLRVNVYSWAKTGDLWGIF